MLKWALYGFVGLYVYRHWNRDNNGLFNAIQITSDALDDLGLTHKT